MRTIVLGAAILFGSGLSAGCDSKNTEQAGAEKTKQAILRVLRADEQATKTRQSLPPKATPAQIAWMVGRYCNDLERLDMADCPADFRVAYKQHLRAWREAQTAIGELPDGFLEGVFMGAMNALLRGEPDGGTGRLEGGVRRSLERVRITWEEVEKIGAKHGAAL